MIGKLQMRSPRVKGTLSSINRTLATHSGISSSLKTHIGWDKAKEESERQKSVKGRCGWQIAIGAEYRTLGIDKSNSRFEQYVSSVFVDCARMI